MNRTSAGCLSVTVMMCLLAASPASGQGASGIAGVVRDTSGAVLPGVTVEAASPALIEKVRSAVTDGEGRYNIVDLRLGTYTVTFSLPGFNTLRREGIVLTAGFTATVNADLQVGGVEETVTVTGASPLVDTQNTRQQAIISSDLLETLPSSVRGFSQVVALTPGITGSVDAGGAAGAYATAGNNMAARGKTGNKFSFDGMKIENMEGAGSAGYMLNQFLVAETMVEMGGVSAESNVSGVAVNAIPRDGGNTFSYGLYGLFTDDKLQGSNLTDELRARGLTTQNKVLRVYDLAATLGGPIKRDRIWFFATTRHWGSRNQVAGIYFNKTQGSPFYTPDLDRPSDRYEWYKSYATRISWQATQRNKFNFVADVQHACTCRREGNVAPEAIAAWDFWPQGLFQVSWSEVVTSKLLLEAGASATISHWPTSRQPGVELDHIAITDSTTGFLYNAATTYASVGDSDRYAQRFALSYVTGSNNFKTGLQIEEGVRNRNSNANLDVSYTFRGTVPTSITQRATPWLQKDRFTPDMGVYAQDQFTINRLTVNAGIRFDYFYGHVPAQHIPATRFVAERRFESVKSVPSWKDVNPRFGASYDLFGTGKTALKASVGRYLGVNAVDIAASNNPISASINNVNRNWTDANGNYVPDCDLTNLRANGECGQVSDLNFGGQNVTTRWADDALRGFGVRDYLWDFSTEVQHQLTNALSLTGGYYRNWAGNFRVTDNVAVGPEDYSSYCITAPLDARLPGGGGYEVCGLYDVSPAKFGQVNNLVTQSSNFGERTRVSDFFTVSMNSRFASGVRIGGGIDTGRTVDDECFVVDAPGTVNNASGPQTATTINGVRTCRITRPFKAQTQIKLFGSYPLPRGFLVSATFQNVPGPNITAAYAVPNDVIRPSLGRNLSACGTRVVCTQTATAPLVMPQTLYEPRRTQFDFRIAKTFTVRGRGRLQTNFDIYNLLNGSHVLGVNNNYGPQWQRPLGATTNEGAVMAGRLIEFSGQFTF